MQTDAVVGGKGHMGEYILWMYVMCYLTLTRVSMRASLKLKIVAICTTTE